MLLSVCMAPVQAARFVDVRVTDALPVAEVASLTLDLAVPVTPGPHPVLVVAAATQTAQDVVLPESTSWLQAMVRLRPGVSAQDLAATLSFVGRQIGAWGGDAERIVLLVPDALLSDVVEALAGNAARPAGVAVQVADARDRAAADIVPRAGLATPLLVLFDPHDAAARSDALRIAANWRRAGARADVLPAPANAPGAGLATALDRWAAAFAVPRLARWESLVPLADAVGLPGSAGRPLALVAHSGRLHVAVKDHGVSLWERTQDGVWGLAQVWPNAEALAWLGTATLDRDVLFAVLVEAARPTLWMREADGRWAVVARASAVGSREVISRVIAQPDRAAALWLVDGGDRNTAVFDLAPVHGASLRVVANPMLAGRLVDANVFDGAVVAATRVNDTVRLWRYEAASAHWQVRARLAADTRTLAVIDGGATLLGFGRTQIERLASTASAPIVELELADAFAALLGAPRATVVRAVAPQAAMLMHPETGEAALAIGIDITDPDPRAPPARYLVRDSLGRYAIGEAWDPVQGRGGWPQALIVDPVDARIVHGLPASGAGIWSARLNEAGPRRGLWRQDGGEGWFALERIGARWIAAVVLPGDPAGLQARIATGLMESVFSADPPGALDFADARKAEPLVVAFDAEARAACAAAGHAAASARVSLGAGDAVRHACFIRPDGTAVPTGLNGVWGGGEGADRWLALVDAKRQRDGVSAEVLLLVRDRVGGVRVVRAAGGGVSGYLDLPLYADCPGCGPRPVGNFQLRVDGDCGAEAAAAGFVLLLPDGAGFRQRAYGAIERVAGPGCY